MDSPGWGAAGGDAGQSWVDGFNALIPLLEGSVDLVVYVVEYKPRMQTADVELLAAQLSIFGGLRPQHSALVITKVDPTVGGGFPAI